LLDTCEVRRLNESNDLTVLFGYGIDENGLPNMLPPQYFFRFNNSNSSEVTKQF
jgi:hypothetical protein